MTSRSNDEIWLPALRRLNDHVTAQGVELAAVPAMLCLVRAVLALAAASDDRAQRRELCDICTAMKAACRATVELARMRAMLSGDEGHDVRH